MRSLGELRSFRPDPSAPVGRHASCRTSSIGIRLGLIVASLLAGAGGAGWGTASGARGHTWSVTPSSDVAPRVRLRFSGTGCVDPTDPSASMLVNLYSDFSDMGYAPATADGTWSISTIGAAPDGVYRTHFYARCGRAGLIEKHDSLFSYPTLVVTVQYPIGIQALDVHASVGRQFTGPVALFVFPRSARRAFAAPVPASEFTATIDWGDGTRSAAQVEAGPGLARRINDSPIPASMLSGFRVIGQHTYRSKLANGKLTVTIHPPGRSDVGATATSTTSP